MNTVEQIDQLVEIAQRIGYRVRYDYFGGTGGGACQIGSTRWLFIDLALSSADQLDQLRQAMENEPLFDRERQAQRAA